MAESGNVKKTMFQCYYCSVDGDFDQCIEHATTIHRENVLKIKKRELDSGTGKVGWRTLNFTVIPSILEQTKQKVIPIVSKDTTSISVVDIEFDDFGIGNLSIDEEIKSPALKKQKTSTPIRPHAIIEDDSDAQFFAKKIDDDVMESDDLLQEMQACLPDVMNTLKDVEQLDSWVAFHRLIKENKFPLDNIAFHLFMDVCRFYSLGTSSSMRYNPIIKKFWRIGYCLFHGKFLNFMSGPKNTGDKLQNTSSTQVKPEDARINFVVPFKSVRKSSDLVDVKPGIVNELVERLASQQDDTKTYKLCIDGKKINAGQSAKSGDIDLFGFETKPTLAERKSRLDDELSMLTNVSTKLNELDVHHKHVPNQFPEADKEELVATLKTILQLIGNRIKDLRKTKVSKTLTLERIKNDSGPDWRASKFVYVISSLQTDLHDLSCTIDELLRSADEVGYSIASMQSVAHRYSREGLVLLEQQENYIHISEHGDSGDETRYVKQGSEKWHSIRKLAKVTGSTLNNAVGLGSVKQQQQHFDSVVLNKARENHSSETLQRMKYGSDNEINAISTLVSKVLPIYEPELVYVEEGCYKLYVGSEQVPMVVSPDGSVRNAAESEARYGVECKCPYPGKTYTTPVFYSLPRYYVTQILAEMAALKTNKLYFICYSPESTSVFLIDFCEQLWNALMCEVQSIYGGKASSRPTKKSVGSKAIKDQIDHFLVENVTFVAELPSVKGVKCVANTEQNLCCHSRRLEDTVIHNNNDIQETVRKCENSIQRAYRLSRTRTTEFLGFMLSDLDRQYSDEMQHAIPIAYGLKGYSLPTTTLREMIEYVIRICFEHGLYIPVCSFDGQWYRMAARDRDDKPLTQLQLQKDVYSSVKKTNKNAIVKKICEINLVKCQDNKLPTGVHIDRVGSCIHVDNGFVANRIVMTQNIAKMMKVSEKRDNERDESRDTDIANDIIASLPVNYANSIATEVIDAAVQAAATTPTEITPSSQSRLDHGFVADNLAEMFDSGNKETTQEEMETNVINDDVQTTVQTQEEMETNVINDDVQTTVQTQEEMETNVINDDVQTTVPDTGRNNQPTNVQHDYLQSLNTAQNLHEMLQELSKQHPELTVDAFSFAEMLTSSSAIDKAFNKKHVVAILSPLQASLKAHGVKCNNSQPKYVLTNILSKIFGDGSTSQPRTHKKKKVTSLINLSKKVVQNLPKSVLNCVYAQHLFPSALREWQTESPFGYDMNINGVDTISPPQWYSRPEYNSAIGNYLFVVLDAYHQICGLRRLFCARGMPKRGVSNRPIQQVAESSENNDSGLSVAVVKDLIDKQSVAFATQTFSEKAERSLRDINASNEADFCELVRNWYISEDEPGLSAMERCEHKLNFRKWLLKGVRFDAFPPYGLYVKDIPIVLFEGLVLGIERKLQLYPFCKTGTYNVRAVGSLDIENFFSTFQDIDPRGTGVLRPDDIPSAIGVATELLDARLDPDRGFYMKTSQKRVYPTHTFEEQAASRDQALQFENPIKDLSVITLRDHEFDTIQRQRGKHARKSGRVSKNFEPARNPVPVREHHRACETKILPHVRRGLRLDL